MLGVLVITSEYSTGTIRASLLAVPRRLPDAGSPRRSCSPCSCSIVGEIVAFCSFFIGSALVNGETFTHRHGSRPRRHRAPHAQRVAQPAGVLRAVFGAGLYLTVLGLFALAIGSLIRHTAGAITTVIGLVLVVFPLAGLLPGSWGAHVHAYLPTVAGQLDHAGQTHGRPALVALAGIRRVLRLDGAAPGRGDLPAPASGRLDRSSPAAPGWHHRLLRLPGARHTIFRDRPDIALPAVEDFIRRIKSNDRPPHRRVDWRATVTRRAPLPTRPIVACY